MKRILLLLTTLLLAPASALHAADASKPTAKPNIVFILAAGQSCVTAQTASPLAHSSRRSQPLRKR
jgi:hypothetical protein